MSLANMSDSKDLDVVVSQVQGSMGPENMLDPKNLGLVVNQAQDSKHVRPKILEFKS